MRAGSPAIPGLNKLAGEVVEVTLTLSLTLRSQQYGILKYTRDPLLTVDKLRKCLELLRLKLKILCKFEIRYE